jgi:2-(1,2-epoxy-1,2-dihydrophenyl)acetyl-CoA isomerase
MDVTIENIDKDVFTIILNRPDKKNAMSLELLKGLYSSLQKAEEKNASVVVIRGSGNTFCSGGDVIEFRDSETPGERVDAMATYLNKSIIKIRSIPSIVVAVLEGLAVGAGLSLTLACDLTIAGETAIMNMGYRRIGLTPDGGASILLTRLIGMKRFNDFYFRSRDITMDEAKQLGLINIVAKENDLESRLSTLIAELTSLPLETTKKAKELVNLSLWQGLNNHLDKERLFVSQFASKSVFQERLKKMFSKQK